MTSNIFNMQFWSLDSRENYFNFIYFEIELFKQCWSNRVAYVTIGCSTSISLSFLSMQYIYTFYQEGLLLIVPKIL